MLKRRLSEIHPLLYRGRIWQKRFFRRVADLPRVGRFAAEIGGETLPFTCKKHQSLLRRKLGNSDPQLQENKVENLKIACPTIDGILIKPRQTFSFWRQLGEATGEKGYCEGMQLSRGEVVRGIGGGLCQLANLLYWMALHTPLEIAERHHHSFDPFPDENRVLPFGSGAGVFYNYIDLRFYNPTELTFQIKLWLTGDHLKGAIYASSEPQYAYHVFEKNHRFIHEDGKNYRENEIWRELVDRRTGNRVAEEMLVKNHAEVKYELNFSAAACSL
ncbi:MAG: VanW family protein [Acidobacteria bacterium]|nr:VanW family protein [Acidobacteriota bacterium]MBK7933581.1 VanW family protein [Acidobacteriota bacterium]